MAISQYTVVTSDDFGKFEDQVNQLIEDGWQLQGGVAATALPDQGGRGVHFQWSQAMVLPPRATPRVKSMEEEQMPLDQLSTPDPLKPANGDRGGTAARKRASSSGN